MPHSKTIRNDKTKNNKTLTVYLIFYKLIFFENVIIFLEPTIKLITGISNNNSYHDGTSAFYRYIFGKRPAP